MLTGFLVGVMDGVTVGSAGAVVAGVVGSGVAGASVTGAVGTTASATATVAVQHHSLLF